MVFSHLGQEKRSFTARVVGMSFVQRHRVLLAELFQEAGPQAPTLCEGWTTHDLLVHLYIREHDFKAFPGIVSRFGRGYLHQASNKLKQEPYLELLDTWNTAPTGLGKFLDRAVNSAEYFVHAVDITRANEQFADRDPSRHLGEEDKQFLLQRLPLLARVMLLKSKGPVIVEPVGGKRLVVADRRGVADPKNPPAVVRGEVGELILWLFGREADVTVRDPKQLIKRMIL